MNPSNIAIICDITNKKPVGVICVTPISGEVSYTTENKELSEVLEIILDNKVFLLVDEDISDARMIREEEVSYDDSYYLMGLNYSLPLPWRILGVTTSKGKVEQLSEEVFQRIKEGGVHDEKTD